MSKNSRTNDIVKNAGLEMIAKSIRCLWTAPELLRKDSSNNSAGNYTVERIQKSV